MLGFGRHGVKCSVAEHKKEKREKRKRERESALPGRLLATRYWLPATDSFDCGLSIRGSVPKAARSHRIPTVAHEPNILAIETSGRVGSVALACGCELKQSARFRADFSHAAELLPTIDELCHPLSWAPGDIDHVYLSIGPGSFTGLRIAVTLARTLALSIKADIVAVATLEVIAQNALLAGEPPPHVAVLLDAKRGQVYSAAFERAEGRYARTVHACIADPIEFLNGLPQPVSVLGEGVTYHREGLASVAHTELPEALWPPRMETVLKLGYEKAQRGEFVQATALGPVYLRRPEAEEVWERRHPERQEGESGPHARD